MSGIIRTRIHDFYKAKGRQKITKKRFSKSSLTSTYDQDELIKSTLLTYSTKPSEVEMGQIDEPAWIQDYRFCCFTLKEVEILRDQIKKQNTKKLTAIHQQKHQKIIRALMDESTSKLLKCQKKLKNIQLANQMHQNKKQQKIFTNIIISLAQKIRATAKNLRQDRQQELNHERQISKFNRSQFDQEIKKISQQNQNESWLSEEGFQILQSKLMQERNQQIMRIVKSIHQLNTIYKQLQDLVIHQGSLLDRIDQNIEQTYENVKQANVHLTKAQQHQKSPFAKKIIVILIFLIMIFFAIFLLRHN